METTWTLSLRHETGRNETKTISISSLADLTLEKFKKCLGVPTSKDYVLEYQDKEWVALESDKDLDIIRNNGKLKVTRRMSSKDERMLENERARSEQKIQSIQKEAQQRSEKRKQLRAIYFETFKGGKIRYSKRETWNYEPDGKVIHKNEFYDDKPLTYEWDGESFQPVNKSFGGGHWDGQTLSWFQKEWEILKNTGKRDVLVSFVCDEKRKRFVKQLNTPLSPGQLQSSGGLADEIESVWEWDDNSIKPEESETGRKWKFKGVPLPVVMFLAILKRIRDHIHQQEADDSSDDSDSGSSNANNSTPKPSRSNESILFDHPSAEKQTSGDRMLTLQQFSYEGYVLLKVGDTGWKKRYFVLPPNEKMLYYYKSADDRQNEEPEDIKLTDCSCSVAMKKDKYCIILRKEESSTLKLYQLLLDSRAERETWLALLIAHGATKAGVRKEGYLKSRQKYWFVLQRRSLMYYDKKEDAMYDKPPKGSIDLVNSSIQEEEFAGGSLTKRRLGFVIQSAKGKKYAMTVDSLTELNEWVQAIRETIEELRKRKESSIATTMKSSQPRVSWEYEEEDLETTGYPFDELDTDLNITFMVGKDLESEEAPLPGEPPLIKAGTLTKLVERLTFAEYADTNYMADFILTFRSFTTPQELLSLLIKRFSMPHPKEQTTDEYLSSYEKKKNIVRLRVYNFIKIWLETNPKDFSEDKTLFDCLMQFATDRMSKVMPDQLVHILIARLHERTKSQDPNNKPVSSQDNSELTDPNNNNGNYPPPILPEAKVNTSDSYTLLDFDTEEIARQLCLIDFRLYRAIKPWEFFNKGWTKEESAPNLFAMIHRFNEFTKWVATEIVCIDELKERAKVLGKWIDIAERCRVHNSISALVAIVSALQSASIFRLKQTWQLIPPQQREVFENLKAFMSREGNFRTIRKYLKTCSQPVVPYMGLYLTDLTFIEDGNPNFTDGGLINFSKRRRLASVLRSIMQHQLLPFRFHDVPFIQNFVLEGFGLEEPECYNLSVHIEPRTGGTVSMSAQELVAFRLMVESLYEKRKQTISVRKTSNSYEPPAPPTPKQDAASKRLQKIKELESKFYTAVRMGNLDKVKSLLSQGIVLTQNVESHHQTPLHVAAYEGHLDVVTFLLGLKDPEIGFIEVDAQDKGGWTALHCAASPGHLDICELLMKHNASPAIANIDKNLPLHYLVRRYIETPVSKKTKGKNIDETQYARVIRVMVENGVDINTPNSTGLTPLHQAAASGNDEGIRVLLRLRADIFATNENGDTPLMWAERFQQTSVLSILREAEAQEEQKRKEKKSLQTFENVKLDDVYAIMKLMRDPDHGVTVKDRKKLLILHKMCFVGEEAVDWLIKNLGVRSREEACGICQKMMDSHFIQCVTKAKVFKDGKVFYQFVTIEDFQSLKAKIGYLKEDNTVISLKSFEFQRVLGEGADAKVFLARQPDPLDANNKKLFAIKAVHRQNLKAQMSDNLMSEKKILQNDSPFLAHLHYCFQTKNRLIFVMDFIGGGDLAFHIKREERFDEEKVKFIIAELVLAIEYLHSRGVVYRDLKPENVLFDSQGHICLTDFGLSKILPHERAIMQTAVGDYSYVAPEVIEGGGYTKSVDWWSLGVIMYQLLLGFTPFEFEDDQGKLIRNILSARILYPEELVSHNARSLLESLLQRNPKRRLEEPDEIKNHPFFHGIDWEALSVKRILSPMKIEMKSPDDVSNFEWKYTSLPIKEEEISLKTEEVIEEIIENPKSPTKS